MGTSALYPPRRQKAQPWGTKLQLRGNPCPDIPSVFCITHNSDNYISGHNNSCYTVYLLQTIKYSSIHLPNISWENSILLALFYFLGVNRNKREKFCPCGVYIIGEGIRQWALTINVHVTWISGGDSPGTKGKWVIKRDRECVMGRWVASLNKTVR
jgi:hypothetical protein